MIIRVAAELDALTAGWAKLPPGFHRHAIDRSNATPSSLAFAAACTQHGLRFGVLDLEPIRDKTALLRALTRALALPATARTGFDAATDALAAYLATPPSTTIVLLWQTPAHLRRRAPDAWRTALDMFAEAAGRTVPSGDAKAGALVLATLTR